MRLTQATNQPCQETTGFLFSHACTNPVANQCDECQKLSCELHTVVEGTSTYCTSCAKRLAGKTAAGPTTRRTYRNNDPYDPYWYSDDWYYGYGYYGPGYWGHSYISVSGPSSSSHGPTTRPSAHDPNDFTDTDASGVQTEGEGDFENEIGGS